MLISFSRHWFLLALASAFIMFAFLGTVMVPAQPFSTTSVIHQIDAAVKARTDNVEGYSVTEHYAVYRSKDEIHPVAWSARLEMCQWRRETLDKESIWDEAKSTSLSRWSTCCGRSKWQ